MVIKQVNEKSIPSNVTCIKWNPLVDLASLVHSSSESEVHLHRLEGWQKVWSLNLGGNQKSGKIVDIEWRPDGKILAAATTFNVLDTLEEGIKQEDGIKNSSICLIEVEHATVTHVVEIKGSLVSCLTWRPLLNHPDDPNVPKSDHFSYSDYFFMDPIEFLEPLKVPNKSTPKGGLTIPMTKLTEESIMDLMKVKSINNMMALAVGTDDGQVLFYGLGLLQVAKCQVNGSVQSVQVIEDYSRVCVYYSNETYTTPPSTFSSGSTTQESEKIKLATFTLECLSTNCVQYLALVHVHAKILTLLRYMGETLASLLESWEDIMIEIDLKLSSYFQTSANEGVGTSTNSRQDSTKVTIKEEKVDYKPIDFNTMMPNLDKKPITLDEFMELLILGSASEKLEKFLTELGEKGLKKLGSSIEVTYSNVQKLIVNHLERICYHLTAYFLILSGVAQWPEEFGCIKLDPVTIEGTISAIGSLLMKCTEVQQVIDTSLKNVKCFFRWLYTVMVRLYNPTLDTTSTPSLLANSELAKISQQDIQFVAQFIDDNFDTLDTIRPNPSSENGSESIKKRSSMFTLEPVGQYFRNQVLTYQNCPMNNLSINPWIQFLERNPSFPEQENTSTTASTRSRHPLIKHNQSHSLIQEFDAATECIKKSVDSVIVELPKISDDSVVHSSSSESGLKSSFVTSFPSNSAYSITSVSKDGILVTKNTMYQNCPQELEEEKSESNWIEFTLEEDALEIVDFACYDSESAFLLLKNIRESYLYKITFAQLLNQEEDTKNGVTKISVSAYGNELIKLTGSTWNTLAASAARKVAVVTSNRRVRLFDLDSFEEQSGDNSMFIN